jgi:hydroxyethylthiazole kinase-like uncharacterized protein yjeF
MTPPEPILTVAQMVAAEQALIDRGETVSSLMETAGAGCADWVWRIAAGRPVTVLCGPGNNGGDGYVIARELARRGSKVTVVAPLEPATEAAITARAAWRGSPEAQGHGGVLVDCLFGSGLTRPLSDDLLALLCDEAARHHVLVAIDLPSGIESDSGRPLNAGLPSYDVTLSLGAWKFAHWLMPAMAAMGERRLVPIGIGETAGAATVLARPRFAGPAADAHKYTRGLVLIVGGAMPGAAVLAAEGALRAGAGAVRLAAREMPAAASPDLVLKPQPLTELLADDRTGAVLIGPGLGRTKEGRAALGDVLGSGLPAVIDADALALFGPKQLTGSDAVRVLTPHAGEMKGLAATFGIAADDKVTQARQLAEAARAVVVAKGPDTVIAAPDGRTVLAPSPTSWLSVAGSGDVLAGHGATRLKTSEDPCTAACDEGWLHGEAARLAGPAFTALELARHVGEAYAAAVCAQPKKLSASPPRATASPHRAAMRPWPRRATCSTPMAPCNRGLTTPSRRAAISASAAGASSSTSTRRRLPASCANACCTRPRGRGWCPSM